MPELPWRKYFPTDAISDPKLHRCSEQTRGIWWFAWTNMMLRDDGKIEGSLSDLASDCRTSEPKMRLALDELKRTGTAEVQEHNGNIILASRRLTRERGIRDLRSKAGRASANKRSTHTPTPIENPVEKKSQHALHIVSASVSEEGSGTGEGNAKVPVAEVIRLSRACHDAFPSTPPATPNQIVMSNVRQLLENGRPALDLERLFGWYRATKNIYKPKSPQALTEPDKFDQWWTMMTEERNGTARPKLTAAEIRMQHNDAIRTGKGA